MLGPSMVDRRNDVLLDRRASSRVAVDAGHIQQRRRGRRPRAGEAATIRVEFVVTRAERVELDAVAGECELTLADVIREAVNEYVSDYRDRKVFKESP